MSKIKSFRGNIAQDGQDTIILHTNDGSVGYRIVKFEIMSSNFGHSSYEVESTVKIFKIKQTSVGSSVDFSDNTLLAAGQIGISGDPATYGSAKIIIFDNEIFNQDIYVTHKNQHSDAAAVNYYIELEQMKLDLQQNTMATLKDIRNETLAI
jgi:hypothetical protein